MGHAKLQKSIDAIHLVPLFNFNITITRIESIDWFESSDPPGSKTDYPPPNILDKALVFLIFIKAMDVSGQDCFSFKRKWCLHKGNPSMCCIYSWALIPNQIISQWFDIFDIYLHGVRYYGKCIVSSSLKTSHLTLSSWYDSLSYRAHVKYPSQLS